MGNLIDFRQVITQIVGHIGGEGSLGEYARMVQDNPQILSGITSALDRDGDGNPINDVLGMAKGLFGGRRSSYERSRRGRQTWDV